MSAGRLINVIRKEGAKYNPDIPFIGEVVSVDPLEVAVGDADPLDRDQMYVIKTEPFFIGQTVIVFPTKNKFKFAVVGAE